ncbi:MAG: ABC transporter ATP-binding protein [Burkholderiaceae bacterium]|nr:ABC transporter ATP-binding protein [Burkholderiaceae bacterium]
MDPIAHWAGVTRRYGRIVAVRDVDLALPPGAATALVGHNGAGKTTLIKLLLGLIRPDAGKVRVAGADPAGSRGAEARRCLGFLPENVAFHGAMTGSELMAFYARLKGQPRARNAELLERVGIAHAADRRISTYSKGMRQRLGIAQALIGEPRLLLLDEPTSGLDPASRADVFDLIDHLRRSGATVLVSTHALAEIEHHVDRIAIMHCGALVAAGTLDDLRRGAQAEVRLRLRVRRSHTDQVLEHLPAGVRSGRRDDESLELFAPAAGKMALLRMLAGLEDIVLDVEMSDVGLAQIYGRLVESIGEAS